MSSDPQDDKTALADRNPFWEPRWYDDQHCCEMTAHAETHGWTLGSHYHCPGCWAETGMYGHHTTFCKVTRTQREFHRCCPDNCELEAKDTAS